MDRLLTYAEWKQIQTDVRHRGWKWSNCFFLPSTFQEKIEAGVLFLQWKENALFLLEDVVSFYRCYYFFAPLSQVNRPELDREAVVEFPFNGELSRNQYLQIECLESMGFVLGRESRMMSCTLANMVLCDVPETTQVRLARPEEIPEISALFEEAFDPRYAFLPTEDELWNATKEDRILAFSQKGQIIAALHAELNKTIASVRQIAVAEQYRGFGLGKALLAAYHHRFAKEASMFQHWVDIYNVQALALYQSFGYEFTLRKANEYLLIPNR